MAKKSVAKSPPKAKVKLARSKPKIVRARTLFDLYEADLAGWVFIESCETKQEAEKLAAACDGPTVIATLELPELKY